MVESKGEIYILKSIIHCDMIKIGWSYNARERVKTINAPLPENLIYLYRLFINLGPYQTRLIECDLHKRYEDERCEKSGYSDRSRVVYREWFFLIDEYIDEIAEVLKTKGFVEMTIRQNN